MNALASSFFLPFWLDQVEMCLLGTGDIPRTLKELTSVAVKRGVRHTMSLATEEVIALSRKQSLHESLREVADRCPLKLCGNVLRLLAQSDEYGSGYRKNLSDLILAAEVPYETFYSLPSKIILFLAHRRPHQLLFTPSSDFFHFVSRLSGLQTTGNTIGNMLRYASEGIDEDSDVVSEVNRFNWMTKEGANEEAALLALWPQVCSLSVEMFVQTLVLQSRTRAPMSKALQRIVRLRPFKKKY